MLHHLNADNPAPLQTVFLLKEHVEVSGHCPSLPQGRAKVTSSSTPLEPDGGKLLTGGLQLVESPRSLQSNCKAFWPGMCGARWWQGCGNRNAGQAVFIEAASQIKKLDRHRKKELIDATRRV